jgi:hypothetical protein
MRHGPCSSRSRRRLSMLATMSFLALELGEDRPKAMRPPCAGRRNAPRSRSSAPKGSAMSEAALWAAAPDRLKNHCYLVTTGDRDPASARARGLFDAVVHAPQPSEASPPLSVLKRRLATDISDARQEDVDAAALFLHRFREAEACAPTAPRRQPRPWPGDRPGDWRAPMTRRRRMPRTPIRRTF